MTFLWPQYLWLLLAVPLLVAFYVWILRRRRKLALRFASLAVIKPAMGGALHWRRHVPPALLLIAVTASLLAAARPLATITLPNNAATIILAMDVSLSMRATDVQPNRLVAAQEAAKVFLKDLPRNIRVAIITFAGTAQVVQPATLVREDLVAAIDRFQMQRGTAIGSGIVVSLSELFPDEGLDVGEMTYGEYQPKGKSLDASAKPKKEAPPPVPPGSFKSAAVVLLTDGRRTTGIDTLEAAKIAADHGVRVYSVGLGTVDGEVKGFDGWSSMYLRLDEPTLKAVAKITQAEYFYAKDAGALKKVYERLSSELRVEKRETEISGLLALGAALFALAAAALSMLWFNRVL